MFGKPRDRRIRLAIVVSHPIQYYVPLYRRLAARDDLELKVFFTWHAGQKPQHDPGFGQDVAWDIPLTEGYEYELVPNVSSRHGSDHFFGLRNPQLCTRVFEWKPNVVHITGYAYASHLCGMWKFHRAGIPVLFRGDSHLLDQRKSWRWPLKKILLRRIYGWTAACLYVGRNNYDYYARIGVPKNKLFFCPHCIEVERFAEPHEVLEAQAKQWRRELGITDSARVLVYAGKFEARKQPIQLMNAVRVMDRDNITLVMIGNGPVEEEISAIARQEPNRYRILPFQNQTKMPAAYRLGDIVALPSAYGETWGLAMNEAMASGRRVLVSDKVGGAPDLVRSPREGAIFASGDWNDFRTKLATLLESESDRSHLAQRASEFDVTKTEETLVAALEKVARKRNPGD
jgi:glycosyltransferase involved in cell wall biosynthesis